MTGRASPAEWRIGMLSARSRSSAIRYRASGSRRRSPPLGWAQAAIDVFETEPLPETDAWRRALARYGARLLLTPHLGYVTDATWRLFYRETEEAVAAFNAGAPIRTL